MNELLKDPIGRDYFWKFLDKEYSSENLRFYEACIQLRFHTSQKDVLNRVKEIYNEFLFIVPIIVEKAVVKNREVVL